MSLVYTPSLAAESACELLGRTLGAHKVTTAALSKMTHDPRLASTRFPRDEMYRHSTLVRMLSITESFYANRLLNEIESDIDADRHAVVRDVWDLKGYIEARNAIAHGLGSLTRRQLTNERATRDALVRVGIDVVAGRISLTDSVLDAAAPVLRRHVLELDEAVASRVT